MGGTAHIGGLLIFQDVLGGRHSGLAEMSPRYILAVPMLLFYIDES